MGNKNDIIEINLGELFTVLLGRAFLIISAGVFFALAGLFISKFVVHPYYDSTTKIYILNKEENQTVTYSDVQISTQLTQDYAELIKSRYVLEEVIQRLNLVDMDFDDLSDVLKVGTLTIDMVIEKWMYLFGVSTVFALELFPSFAQMLTDAYIGAYINNQKTIEKVCGGEMVAFTKALLEIGGRSV